MRGSTIRNVLLAAALLGTGACDAQDSGEGGGRWQRRQTSWALQSVDGALLTVLAVREGDSDCERLDGVETVEDGDSVEIRAFTLVRVPAEDETLICLASAIFEPVTVELEAPLGDRELTGCSTSLPIDSVVRRSDCRDIQSQG